MFTVDKKLSGKSKEILEKLDKKPQDSGPKKTAKKGTLTPYRTVSRVELAFTNAF